MSTRGKLDTSLPLFCAKRQAKEGTVFDTIRKIVGEQPEGMQYQALLDYLSANWQPEKAETYGPGYIRAYVTGGIKEGYLTQDPALRVEYSFRLKGGAKALKAAKTESKPSAPKAVTPTSTYPVLRNDVLQFIREKHSFNTFEDSGEYGTKLPEIADGLSISLDQVQQIVTSCAEDKLLTVATDGYIFFTREGFKQTKRIVETV